MGRIFCDGGTPESAEIRILGIKKEKKKGIGGKLVDFMIKAAGNSDIRLGVLVSNTAAVRLYRSRGFEILYEIDDYGGYKKPAVKVYEMIRLYDKAYSDNR